MLRHLILPLFILLGMALCLPACKSSQKTSQSQETPTKKGRADDKDKTASSVEPFDGTIKWITIQEAAKLSEKKPRKIIMDVYTDWCGWCKKMDASTFQHPAVAKYISENFYAVKLNGESKDVINFKGKDYKFVQSGMRGYNELAAFFLNGQLGYPSIVFLDEKLDLIQTLPGYKDAKTFDLIAHFFGQNEHKKGTFDQFAAQYKSIIE